MNENKRTIEKLKNELEELITEKANYEKILKKSQELDNCIFIEQQQFLKNNK